MNDSAVAWCELVEKAVVELRPPWVDMWLNAVGGGSDAERLAKGQRLLVAVLEQQRQYLAKATARGDARNRIKR